MTDIKQLQAENAALLRSIEEYRDTNAILVGQLLNPQWEYALLSQRDVSIRTQTVAEFLNEEGQYGWELCGIDYGCFIMKRRKA